MIPRATMRLQLHEGFGFDDAARHVEYFSGLGVSHIYVSPILTARPGSMHGYDVVDHATVSSALGGEDGLLRLVETLRRYGLGLIVDIVPNHMAVDRRNRRWLDVLENGPASRFADFFEIDWQSPDPCLRGKVLVPVLGAPYGRILQDRQIALQFDEDSKRIVATYGDHIFPIRTQDYADVLHDADGPLSAFVDQLAASGDDGAARDAAWQKLVHAVGCDGGLREALNAALASLALQAGHPSRLDALLNRQHYRLSWWRTAGDELNWRRFFDINELIAVRIDRPEVFDTVHEVVLRLYENGMIDGLRVDHIDGLTDPAGYCRQLRHELSVRQPRRPAEVSTGSAYLIVEKILAPGERLSRDWPVDGTTGYEFMNEVTALLHDGEGAPALGKLWHGVSGRSDAFEAEEEAARAEILERHFAGQLEATVSAMHHAARLDLVSRDLSRAGLRRALVGLLRAFPRYRTYATRDGGCASDSAVVEEAGARALPLLGPVDAPPLDWIVDLLRRPGYDRPEQAAAAIRFQQLSAPLAAKAVEDTAFYRYGRLLSRNDVGFDPARLESTPDKFHRVAASRAEQHPSTLLATATHDHKRGEDVRARLAVLSEIPALWAQAAHDWFAMNAALRPDRLAAADEFMLYQTIVGAWPLDLGPHDGAGLSAFAHRLAQWQVKALREGKLRSSWMAPDLAYEEAAGSFLGQLFSPEVSSAFLASVDHFVRTIAPAGALNGLGQILLRCTVPGVPDLYQGAEFWDLSLVDPDNRRPVDFAGRAEALSAGATAAELLPSWRTGAVKQAVIGSALALRRDIPDLFACGSFEQLEVEGRHPRRIYAFLRRTEAAILLVAVSRHCAGVLLDRHLPLPPRDSWGDTALVLPHQLQERAWRDLLTGRRAEAPPSVPAHRLFAELPVALRVAV